MFLNPPNDGIVSEQAEVKTTISSPDWTNWNISLMFNYNQGL